MIKVINGKRYNTETATMVADWYTGHPSDFQYCNEELYLTNKGNWFLFGEGGAMSKYAQPVGNNAMGGGKDIIPFTPEAACAWLEAHNCIKELEQYFPDYLEDA